MDWFFSVNELADWLKSFGWRAILISIAISIVISLFGVIPTVLLSGANAVVFGFVPGFIISLVGEVLGAGVSYWLYKWGFVKTKIKQENWTWLQRLKHSGRKRQNTILFIARVTPLIPSGVITFIAAIANMRFGDFMIVTLLGKTPSIAMETLVGHDLIRINENLPRLLISLGLLLLLYILYKRGNKQ